MDIQLVNSIIKSREWWKVFIGNPEMWGKLISSPSYPMKGDNYPVHLLIKTASLNYF
jgi:hypothetical protein